MGKGIDPTTLNIEFVEEGLPAKVKPKGGVRKSKWDVIVEKLSARPGVWARIGQPGTKPPADTASLRKKGLEAALRSEGQNAENEPIVQLWVRYPHPDQFERDEAARQAAEDAADGSDTADAADVPESQWNTESVFADD